jgi:hypothetical protein
MIITKKGLRSLLRCARESTWGEGESPAAELVDLEGGEGQESIGFFRVVKRTMGVRILGRSKTLELRAHGLPEVAFDGLSMNRSLSNWTLYTMPHRCCPTALQCVDVVRHSGNLDDVGHDPVRKCSRRIGGPDGLCASTSRRCCPTALQCVDVVRHGGNLDDVGHDPVRWCRGRMDAVQTDSVQ